MKIAIICFSLNGALTAGRLEQALAIRGGQVTISNKSAYLPDPISCSTGEWAKKNFEENDALIFIGAAGICVRSIAPLIVSKKTDPAVLVIDELGKNVISLLSGHLGGANELTAVCAEILHANPVITTATDLNNRFAVDMFAKKNQCSIKNMTAAKEVSAALLAGKKVGFYSEFPYKGQLPAGLSPAEEGKLGIAVTIHKDCKPFEHTVQVIPKILTLGMGCKKNKEGDTIIENVKKVLHEKMIAPESIEKLTSIDLKKEEQGLLALSKEFNIPFITYPAQELLKAEGDFTPSDFVSKVTGVDNVCERSAVLGSGGTIIQKKIGGEGMTIALALRNWRISFE